MCFLIREGTHRDAASEEMYRKLALERARHPCFASGPFKRFQGTRDLSTALPTTVVPRSKTKYHHIW